MSGHARHNPAVAGFTLIELVTATMILVILMIILAGLSRQAIEANRLASGYADDVLGLQRALAAVERDLRGATAIAVAGDRLDVETPAGSVVYRLRAGALERLAGNQVQPLARNVERFEPSRSGRLVRVALTLGRRAGEATREPTASTAVRLRNLEGER